MLDYDTSKLLCLPITNVNPAINVNAISENCSIPPNSNLLIQNGPYGPGSRRMKLINYVNLAPFVANSVIFHLQFVVTSVGSSPILFYRRGCTFFNEYGVDIPLTLVNGGIQCGSGSPCIVPQALISGGPLSFCQGDSVTLTANAGSGLTYQWYLGIDSILGATNRTLTVRSGGSFSVKVSSSPTCSTISSPVFVTVFSRPLASIQWSGNPIIC